MDYSRTTGKETKQPSRYLDVEIWAIGGILQSARSKSRFLKPVSENLSRFLKPAVNQKTNLSL